MRCHPLNPRFLLLLLLATLSTGCTAVRWAGIQMFYEPAPLLGGRVVRDLPYLEDGENQVPKHRLDLFLPATDATAPWPTILFVHGGGWTSGDKALRVGGADIYGNVGRFYAAHGLGVAVINYRLQPEVTWKEQVADVASATAWVHRNIARYGGAADQIFLVGHSAGAQLVTFVALNGALLQAQETSTAILCGTVPVSGAGYDLVDEETYRLGAQRDYNASRFQAGDPDGVWERQASSMTYLSDQPEDVPPFLLPFSRREWPGLQYQNQLLHDALQNLGVESRLLPIKGQSHARMVLQLTDPKSPVARAALEFFASVPCPRG